MGEEALPHPVVEWLVGRRYLSEESLALVLEGQGEVEREEVAQLQTA